MPELASPPRCAWNSVDASSGSMSEYNLTYGLPILPDESKSPKSYREYTERRTLRPASQSLRKIVELYITGSGYGDVQLSRCKRR